MPSCLLVVARRRRSYSFDLEIAQSATNSRKPLKSRLGIFD